MKNQEVNGQKALEAVISGMSRMEKFEFFLPMTRKCFFLKKNWVGREQIISYVNANNQRITYNHDVIHAALMPKLRTMKSWNDRGYYSVSNIPSEVRHLAEYEDLNV